MEMNGETRLPGLYFGEEPTWWWERQRKKSQIAKVVRSPVWDEKGKTDQSKNKINSVATSGQMSDLY